MRVSELRDLVKKSGISAAILRAWCSRPDGSHMAAFAEVIRENGDHLRHFATLAVYGGPDGSGLSVYASPEEGLSFRSSPRTAFEESISVELERWVRNERDWFRDEEFNG